MNTDINIDTDTDTDTDTVNDTDIQMNNEEMSYRYIDDDELQKDYITGVGLSESNIPEKVYFYFYSIILPKKDTHVLKVYLNGGDAEEPEFHSIEIDKNEILSSYSGDDSADLNDIFVDYCMEKLTTTLLHGHDIVSNYLKYYKGFISNETASEIMIVFELPSKFSDSNFSPFFIDEILNKTRASHRVRDFFYKNEKMIYITKENYENYEIPQIFYGDGGGNISRKKGEYGYFYSFKDEPFENSAKYIGFVDDKTYYGGAGAPENINSEFDACVIYSFKTNEWYFKSREFFFLAEPEAAAL